MQRQGASHQQPVDSSVRIIVTKLLSISAILLRILLWPLRLFSSFLFLKNDYDGLQTGDKAALAFKSYSQKVASSNAIEFESMSYSKCIAEGHRRNQFLFVYLHSPMHPYSDAFLRMMNGEEDGLCLSSVLTDCIKWGGNIHHAEACKVAADFQVSSYPFCALLVCKSRTSVEIFWRLHNTLTLSDLCANIGTAIALYYPILREEENRRNRRREEIQLRQEQDREFQQTLLEDQRREAERHAHIQQERQALLQAQREIELAQQRQQSRLDNARALLPKEPTTGNNLARLRIMFPSGTRTERRFSITDTIQIVKAYVILYMHDKSIPISNFQLEMNYPKKVLSDESLTIEQSGLGKMAVLMVVDLDA